jgi:hypothetical protein
MLVGEILFFWEQIVDQSNPLAFVNVFKYLHLMNFIYISQGHVEQFFVCDISENKILLSVFVQFQVNFFDVSS